MRGVSKSVRGWAAVVALLTVLVAQGAAARERDAGRTLVDRFEKAKRFVVTIFSRIGLPPG